MKLVFLIRNEYFVPVLTKKTAFFVLQHNLYKMYSKMGVLR